MNRGVFVAVVAICMLLLASSAEAVTLPAGFRAVPVFEGLQQPAAVRFSGGLNDPVFVAEKRGVVQGYTSTADATPTTVVDLRQDVYNRDDRGLLGLAIDPGWPTRPYLYVLYARDAPIGGVSPTWGGAADYDACPLTNDACRVSGRLVRIKVNPATLVETAAADRVTLVDDWCQQFSSHSIGDLRFGPGPNPQLYASGGDGASYDDLDYGQFGTSGGYGGSGNVCGDPPGGTGDLTGATAEGGALRSQDLRTPGDPTGLSGSIIRIDPDTGLASAGNPLVGTPGLDENARRIIAEGLRNPFRFAVRPGTGEVWTGEVGWQTWEELNRIADPGGQVENFGWPCYEGVAGASARQKSYEAAGLNICSGLYAAGTDAVTAPYWTYDHKQRTDACAMNQSPLAFLQSSSISGVAFQNAWDAPKAVADPYPASYSAGGLYLADYARGCIWFMPPGAGGLPDPGQLSVFATFQEGLDQGGPVGLEPGPGGELYWVDLGLGRIMRAEYSPDRPVARASADRAYGATPLDVHFDASASSDPQGDALTYAWDLDGDGSFETDTGSTAAVDHTYSTPGTFFVRARVAQVNDPSLASVSAPIRIDPGNTPPHDVGVTVQSSPALQPLVAGAEWYAGQSLKISGAALDAEDGGAPALDGWSWDVILRHCQGDTCHSHTVVSELGKSEFFLKVPDHDYPSYLQIRLMIRDSDGLVATRIEDVHPASRVIKLRSEPTGRTVTLGAEGGSTPQDLSFIRGGQRTLSAAATEQEDGRTYVFDRWKDDAAAPRTRQVTMWEDNAYTALYRSSPSTPEPSVSGSTKVGGVLTESHPTIGGSAPLTITRQWERCDAAGANCIAIAGETAGTHTVTTADLGARLRVVVSADNDLGRTSAPSAPTTVVVPAAAAPSGAGPAAFRAEDAFRLPAAKTCLRAGGRLTLTWRRPKTAVNRVEVWSGSRRLARRDGRKARSSITVKVPRSGRFSVSLRVWTGSGKPVVVRRTYRICGGRTAVAARAWLCPLTGLAHGGAVSRS